MRKCPLEKESPLSHCLIASQSVCTNCLVAVAAPFSFFHMRNQKDFKYSKERLQSLFAKKEKLGSENSSVIWIGLVFRVPLLLSICFLVMNKTRLQVQVNIIEVKKDRTNLLSPSLSFQQCSPLLSFFNKLLMLFAIIATSTLNCAATLILRRRGRTGV